MAFMSEHPMIRPLSDYGQFVHDAFQQRGDPFMNDALRGALKKLRLSGLLESLEVRLQEAAGHGLSHARVPGADPPGRAGGPVGPPARSGGSRRRCSAS